MAEQDEPTQTEPAVSDDAANVADKQEEKSVDEPAQPKAAPKVAVKPRKPVASAKSKKPQISSKKPAENRSTTSKQNFQVKYPRHSVSKALRMPRAILEQNAGRECSESEAAAFLGFKLNGEIYVEISSAIKYGLLERPSPRRVKVSDLARKMSKMLITVTAQTQSRN